MLKKDFSQYVLLISKKATSFDKIACEILNKYLLESIGVKLDIVVENEKKIQKFISVGNTDIMLKKAFEIRHGFDGYTVKEADKNLYLFGQSDSSVIWAAQAFLEKAVGYKFYAKDEVKIDKVDSIDFIGYDFYYTPTIPNRASGFGVCSTDTEYATGLKAYAWFGERADGSPFWGTWSRQISCHNHLIIMPLEKYYDAHPEWYNDKKNQLCLSNLEMRDEFFKNLVGYFEKFSTQTHFLLGHEDNGDMCYCENCKKRIDAVGTGGLHVEFINDIARRTEKWRKENCPERQISVGMFAYSTKTSMKPPVKKVDGKIVPVSDSVILEPNVFILFAPIGAKEHSRPITDPANEYYYRCFEMWNTLCKRFGIWMYYATFRRSFEFADGIYIFKQNIEALQKFGCDYFYVECNSNVGAVMFQKMHLYVLTQLEWDVSQDTDTLINEFMNAYYKCAAPQMRKVFDCLTAHYAKVRARTERLTGRKFYYGMCHRDTNPEGIWDLNIVYDVTVLLDEADLVIKNSDYSEEVKSKLKDRVDIERLFTLFVQLEYFVRIICPYDEARSINTFPKDVAHGIVDRFVEIATRLGIKKVDGDGTIDQTVAKWRNEIDTTARGWENAANAHIAYVDEMFKELKK